MATGVLGQGVAMNDPEKLYLLCQCFDEMLHFARTFELHCKKNKSQIYSIRLPKIWFQIVDVLVVPALTAVVEKSHLVAQPASLIVQYLIPKFIK